MSDHIPYRTKDLNEAAFIWSQTDARLTAVEAEIKDVAEGRKPETFYFVFDLFMSDEALRELMFAYANEETQVEPQLFIRKLSNLRDRLYAVKKKFKR